MQQIVLNKPGSFELNHDAPEPNPAAGEALVAVKRIGICGTDLHAYRGKQPFFEYPRVLGHELGVEILEVGENDRGLKPGDRCAVEPYLNCGQCEACLADKPNCCVNMRVLGVHVEGGMRPKITVPTHKLHPSTTLAFDQLALVETLGIGAHAVERATPKPGERVLVIGAGPIGLGVIQFAKVEGAEVTVLDISESRLAFCEQQLGVTTTQSIDDDQRFHAVLDATGNPRSMANAFNYVAHGGRLIFVGLFQGDLTFHDPLFHKREMSVLASRNSLPQTFTRIIDLMEQGRIDTTPWITHRAAFTEMIDQFETWLDPQSQTIKAIVEMD